MTKGIPPDGERPRAARPYGKTFSALRYRDFRLVWIGAFVSTSGTWMQTLAQAWVVLEITGSAFYLGLDAFLAMLPMILFSLVGGAVADRIERRRILFWSQIFQMTFALVLAALLFFDVVRVWQIFVLSFLTGTVQAFGGPAYQAMLPLLVSREDVPNAVAMNSLQFNLARMIGPVLAGVALATVGAAACFLLNALSFLAVIATLLAIRPVAIPPRERASTMGEDIREGLRFMGERPAILQLTLLAFCATFFGIPLVTLLPVVAKSVFAMGATGYSMLMTAQGAGAVLGAFVVASASFRRGAGRSAIISALLFAAALATFSFSQWLPLSLAAVFVAGAALLGVVTVVSSLVQLATPEAIRGRVLSIFMLAFRGGMPLGNLLAGWNAERFGVTFALGVNAFVLAAIGLAFLGTRNRVRE
ncbi:MAG TPA: MFS transporter, partial [Thermoanaerobaculia bacterium]|nr:MFS transporter [Thermoanaerobaculia bacterium]